MLTHRSDGLAAARGWRASRSREFVAWHHRRVSSSADAAEPSPLAIDQSPLARFAPRFRLDASTLMAVIVAVLVVLAVLAVLRNSSAMLTRIGLGVLIAMALDAVVNALVRRLHVRRGVVVVGVAVAVVGVAVLVVTVLAPRAIAEVQNFSEQLPATVGELEQLPLVGGWVEDQDLVGACRGVGGRPSRAIHRRANRGVGALAAQWGRERRRGRDRRRGRARRRREPRRPLPPPAQPVAATPGRRGRQGRLRHARPLRRWLADGGRDDGVVRARCRPRPRRAAGAPGGGVGDADRPHSADRWRPRRDRVRRLGAHRERSDGDHRRCLVRRPT